MRHLLFLVTVGLIALFSFVSTAESQGKKKAKTPIWSENKDLFGDPLPLGALARIGAIRYRLPDWGQPNAMVLSPDGKRLAVVGPSSDIDIWELPAWTKQQTIRTRFLDKKNPPFFNNLVYSPDGKKLLASDQNRQVVFLLDPIGGTTAKKFAVPQKPNNGTGRAIITPDEKTLIWTVRGDRPNGQVNEYVIWDLEKDKQRHAFEVPINRFDNQLSPPTISADGRWLVQVAATDKPGGRGGIDASIEFCDLTTGKPVRKIETENPMRSLALSPDGKWLAVSDGASILRFYDAPTGKEIHNVRLRRTFVSLLQFAPDSGSLYIAENNGAISQWSPAQGEQIARYKAPINAGVRYLAFLPGGGVRALGVGIEAIHYWDVKTGKAFSPLDVPTGFINDVCFAKNGDLFVASEDGLASWWNPRTGGKLRDLKLELMDPQNYFGGIDYGSRDIVFNDRGFLYPRGGGMLTMSRDGDFLASGDGGAAAIYDARTGKLLYDDMVQNNGNGGAICFLDAGHKAASIQAKKIRVWNTRTGRDAASFELPLRNQEFAFRLSASPDGKFFAAVTNSNTGDGNQGRVILWDADKKQIAREWPMIEGQGSTLFSPDGQWLAIAGSPSQVRLVRVNNPRGDHTLDLGLQNDSVTQLAFSRDGRQLACAIHVPHGNSSAGKIVVYEIASKKVRLALVGHPGGEIMRLAYSHDGGLLASGATDTTVLVWQTGLQAFAEKRADKDATADELNDWFDQLAGANPRTAFQHMVKLAQTPAQAVKHLDAKIAPAQKPDTGGKPIAQWIRELGSNQFPVRSRANATLQKLAGAAEPDLNLALPNAQDVETKRRIEDLLDRIALNEWTLEELQQARAVEVLEAIGTAEARAVLTRWTSGHPGAVLTKQARLALSGAPSLKRE